MSDFFYLVPIALVMGIIGLCAFMWSLKSEQYEDLDGAAERILFEDEDRPARSDPPIAALKAPASPVRSPHRRGSLRS